MLLEGLKKLKIIVAYPAFLVTLGVVGWFEAVFTIEWAFPYCSSLEDGAASAVFGMPLPYIRHSAVSSLEYELMPSIFLVNILILFAIVFTFVSWAIKKVSSSHQSTRRNIVSFAGLVLVLSISAWTILLLQLGYYKYPVSTIGDDYYGRYSEFRPVRFTFKDLHYNCTPSNYWFKDDRWPQSRANFDDNSSIESRGK